MKTGRRRKTLPGESSGIIRQKKTMKMKSLLYSAVVLSGATLALALPPVGRGEEFGIKDKIRTQAATEEQH